MAGLSGYRRLSPSELEARGLARGSRRIETPSGETISRRQFENIRIRAAGGTLEGTGWRSWSDFQRSRRNPQYQWDMKLALTNNPDVTAKQMRKIDSEFNRRYLEARPFWSQRRSPEYRDPNGPIAEFLVYLGLRDEDAEYDVGMTGVESE